jgi:hypothetical protein
MRFVGVACLLALATAVPAAASPRLLVGVTEDGLKFEPDVVRRDATAVGVDAVRITLAWRSGLTSPTSEQRTQLDRATSGAAPLRLVLSVFGEQATDAPQAAAARDEYCEFLGQILSRYSRIRDVAIWNEPNKTLFWQPQFDAQGHSAAPAAYEALLARCWDVLHAERPDVNVLAPSTAPRGNDRPGAASSVSHSPVRFFEELGRAYRASGRDRPIFDTVAHHVHGDSPGEPPWQRHPGRTIAEGDYRRLLTTLQRAFRGTAQLVPGHCVGGRCASIWYGETGFETVPDARKARAYTGEEIVDAISPAEQASQLERALEIAYCQPYVEGFFNFLLWDEHRLEGWQSGLYWSDRTEKPSAHVFRETVRDIRARRVRCARLRQQVPHAGAVLGPPRATPAPGPTTTMTTTTTATSGSAPEHRPGGGGGLTARVLVPGAVILLLVGIASIALGRRIRARRNSR